MGCDCYLRERERGEGDRGSEGGEDDEDEVERRGEGVEEVKG